MAGVGPDDIAVVCAHATATVQNDASETEVLRLVFAGHDAAPPVMATKGAFGHALGATGLIESIALLLALRNQLAPPIPELRTPVPGFPLPLPVKSPMPFTGSLGLNLTLGIGGFNTCLVFQRGDAE
jgi:3-oxoacyl-[acyl-carrier-protein] synthase II